jgi:N-acylglucosamine-6-phosphate 2-epimerase
MNQTTLRPLYSLDDFVTQVRGQLIVSCQALPDEPLYGAEIMARMAVAAQKGGARAIRANTPVDIAAIRAAVNLPIIGLYKEVCPGYPVYITPTLAHAKAVADAGADLVAIDATARPRPQPGCAGRLHRRHPLQKLAALVLADIATADEALAAAAAGADLISTTMSGYTADSPQTSPALRRCAGTGGVNPCRSRSLPSNLASLRLGVRLV